jgi:hypothetical protein
MASGIATFYELHQRRRRRPNQRARTMPFSDKNAQGAIARATPRRSFNRCSVTPCPASKSAAMPVRAMDVAVVPARPATVTHMLMGHREPALCAELGPFSLHTRRYLRHVGDKIGTNAHRIGRACLAGLVAALRSGAAHSRNANSNKQQTHSNKQQTHRQCRPADETHDTQHVFPSFPWILRVTRDVSA